MIDGLVRNEINHKSKGRSHENMFSTYRSDNDRSRKIFARAFPVIIIITRGSKYILEVNFVETQARIK